jgi:hypothetical protein
LDNLLHLAPTFLSSAFVAFREELIGAVQPRSRCYDRVKGEHRNRFVELAARELLPESVDSLLRRQSLLSLLLLVLVVA